MDKIIIRIAVAIALSGWLYGAPFAEAMQKTDNIFCLDCHSNPDLKPFTEKGQRLELFVAPDRYGLGVHRKMACQECHPGVAGKDSFNKIPHDFKAGDGNDCLKCHPACFKEIEASFKQSHHYKKLDGKTTCSMCHDAHTMGAQDELQMSESDVYQGNMACIRCHTDLVGFKALSGREVFSQDFSHSFLPFKEEHFNAVRCVECHTPHKETDLHQVLPKEQSLADCTVCHSETSLLISRIYTEPTQADISGSYLGKGLFDDLEIRKKLAALPVESQPVRIIADPAGDKGFVNQGIFADSYLIGGTRNIFTDKASGLLLIIVLAAVAFHGALRLILMRRSDFETAGQSRPQYVYDRSVRMLHWINAAAFIVLIPTGFSQHFAGKSGVLPFDLSVELHHWAALLLTVNYLIFVLMGIATGNIRSYIPSSKGGIAVVWRQARFYLYGIFKGEANPFRASRRNRFNPLQKSVYLPLMYLTMPLLILSGACMLFPQLTPQSLCGYPGRWLTATFHYVLAVAFTAFLIAHLYLGTTGKRVTSFYKAIITGYE